MIETFYVQINEENIITDIISYKYSNYKEVQINVPLPPKIASGCYRLVGDEVVYVPSLDNVEQMNKILALEKENETLKQELSITQDAVNELIFNSLNI
ncbi:MAG: hypothetical protein J6D47_19010 [Peptostreptococcaceae bacterium]|nr:hypothetical protein [Peptostreptococcaceae bacterium]